MQHIHQRNGLAAKLTLEQVRELRHKYQSQRISQGALARAYGISVVQIGRIVRGEVWQDNAAQPGAREIEESARRMFEVQREVDETGIIPVMTTQVTGIPEVSDSVRRKTAGYLGEIDVFLEDTE